MTILMKQFGAALTGREYGKNVAEKFFAHVDSNSIELSFEGVTSLGSSFGDEIFKALKANGLSEVKVSHSNRAVSDCLKEIQNELSIKIVNV